MASRCWGISDKGCLSTALTWHPLIALVPLVFGHWPCLCCFLRSFHCQGHQDAHGWFCSLLSSLKLILLLLIINSNIPYSLLIRKLQPRPFPRQPSALCLAGHVRSCTDRLHVPYPPWSSSPLLVSQPLPGFQGSNSNVKRLLSDKASHIWRWNLSHSFQMLLTTIITDLIQFSGWHLQQRLLSEHAVFRTICRDGLATLVTQQDKCYVSSWPLSEAHCRFSSFMSCSAPWGYQAVIIPLIPTYSFYWVCGRESAT